MRNYFRLATTQNLFAYPSFPNTEANPELVAARQGADILGV